MKCMFSKLFSPVKGTFSDAILFQAQHQPCSENTQFPDRQKNTFQHSKYTERWIKKSIVIHKNPHKSKAVRDFLRKSKVPHFFLQAPPATTNSKKTTPACKKAPHPPNALMKEEILEFRKSPGLNRCIQSVSRVRPKISVFGYYEVALLLKEKNTTLAVGMATKPYPPFRLPGMDLYSIGYLSNTGFVFNNDPFEGAAYGPTFDAGDTVGCGFMERVVEGKIFQYFFFTLNGKFLGIAATSIDLFPGTFACVGADGPCWISVNFGTSRPFLYQFNTATFMSQIPAQISSAVSLTPRLLTALSSSAAARPSPLRPCITPELKRAPFSVVVSSSPPFSPQTHWRSSLDQLPDSGSSSVAARPPQNHFNSQDSLLDLHSSHHDETHDPDVFAHPNSSLLEGHQILPPVYDLEPQYHFYYVNPPGTEQGPPAYCAYAVPHDA
eukprot:Sdes_comp20358_c0_seq1m14146